MKKTTRFLLITCLLYNVSCLNNDFETNILGIQRIEELIFLNKYREAKKECERFLDITETKQEAAHLRPLVSDYLRLCLLKTGNLNNNFYSYKINIKEMFHPIVQTGSINLASTCFVFELGIPLSTSDTDKMLFWPNDKSSPLFWSVIEKNSIITGRDRFYECCKNFCYPKNMKPIQVDREKTIKEWRRKTNTTPKEKAVEINPFNLPESVYNMFQTCRDNKEILETYTAMMLFIGRLDVLPEIVERYNYLGYVRLPNYVQEAIMIFLQRTNINNYYGFQIEDNIKNRYINFWQTMNSIQVGMENPRTIKEKFGETYTYYYFMEKTAASAL